MCCNGCGEVYSTCSFQSHLLQTNSATCKEEHQKNQAHLAGITDEDTGMDIDNEDEPPWQLEGDFFRADYGVGDFEDFSYILDSDKSQSDSGDLDLAWMTITWTLMMNMVGHLKYLHSVHHLSPRMMKEM